MTDPQPLRFPASARQRHAAGDRRAQGVKPVLERWVKSDSYAWWYGGLGRQIGWKTLLHRVGTTPQRGRKEARTGSLKTAGQLVLDEGS